jgi:hypothetical protein
MRTIELRRRRAVPGKEILRFAQNDNTCFVNLLQIVMLSVAKQPYRHHDCRK